MYRSLEDKSTKIINHHYYNNSGDFFMRVKIFDESHELDLEKSINSFLNNDMDIIDIKYQVAISVMGDEQLYCFSAMIIYNE